MKVKRIYARDYAIVGNSDGPSSSLAPGEFIPLNEDLASHRYIASQIDQGLEPETSLLEIREVDPEQEKAAEVERQELLAKAEEIARQQQEDELKKQQQAAGAGIYNPEEHNVADVVAYLKDASAEEVARVKELEASSDRKSVQVANFEPSTGGGG